MSVEAIRELFQQTVKLYQALLPSQRRNIWLAGVTISAGLVAITTFVYSSKSYVAVLSGRELAGAELDRAEQTLVKDGLSDHHWNGSRLMVPATQVEIYNAALRKDTHIQKNTERESQRIGSLTGLLTTPRQQDHLQEIALREELERVIGEIPGIQVATVIWARGKEQNGWRRELKVTATLNVVPDDGFQLSIELRRALRAAVANMVADLKPDDIVVLDQSTGRTYSFYQDQVQGDQSVASLQQPAQFSQSKVKLVELEQRQERPDLAQPTNSDWRIWMGAAGLCGLMICVAWSINQRASRPAKPNTGNNRLAVHVDSIRPPDGDAADVEFERKSHAIDTPPQGSTMVNYEKSVEEPPGNRRSDPFAFLRDVDHDRLLRFIDCEQPQTIAVIVSHLPAKLTKRLLEGLSSEKCGEVLRRIENLESISPEVVHGIADNLKGRFIWDPTREATDQSSARTTSNLDTQELSRFAADGSALHRGFSVSRAHSAFSGTEFDDLANLQPSSLKSLWPQIDSSQWAVALKGASEKTKQRLFDNLSTREKERLKEEINQLGPVKIGDIEEMQRLVIGAASRLEMVV